MPATPTRAGAEQPDSPTAPDLLVELLVLAALNENPAAQGVRELGVADRLAQGPGGTTFSQVLLGDPTPVTLSQPGAVRSEESSSKVRTV